MGKKHARHRFDQALRGRTAECWSRCAFDSMTWPSSNAYSLHPVVRHLQRQSVIRREAL